MAERIPNNTAPPRLSLGRGSSYEGEGGEALADEVQGVWQKMLELRESE